MIGDRSAGSVYTYPFHGTNIGLVGVHHPSLAYEVGFYHDLFKQLDLLV